MDEILTLAGLIVADNYDSVVIPTITFAMPDGSSSDFDAIDWSQPLEYGLYIEAEDFSGNTASHIIIVRVVSPPPSPNPPPSPSPNPSPEPPPEEDNDGGNDNDNSNDTPPSPSPSPNPSPVPSPSPDPTPPGETPQPPGAGDNNNDNDTVTDNDSEAGGGNGNDDAGSPNPPMPPSVPGSNDQSQAPTPTAPGNNLVQDGDTWIEFDDMGVPLGTWSWDNDNDMWIFDDMNVPLIAFGAGGGYVSFAAMPQTGLAGNLSQLIIGLLGSIALAIGAVFVLRKVKMQENLRGS